MATWPVTLPPPIYGMGMDPKSKVISTDMEVGLPRSRRRSSARHDEFQVAWELSEAQMEIFRNWFEADVFDGAGWFTVDLPDGYNGFSTVEARFKSGNYSSKLDQGMIWTVSATLEVE